MPGGNPCFTGTDEPGKASLWGREPCEGYAEHIDGLSRPRLRPLREASRASGGVLTLPLAGERTRVERSGPSGSATLGAKRCRMLYSGAFKPEWQCRRRGAARSGPSGSASHTATRYRTHRIGTHGPEWQCAWCARVRVAVQLTLRTRDDLPTRRSCIGAGTRSDRIVLRIVSGAAPLQAARCLFAGGRLSQLVRLICPVPQTI